MKARIPKSLLFVLFALCVHPLFAADWWTMPDPDFVKQYGNLATGSQQQQSQFAWMMFARVNQPATLNGATFSQWELWKSDPDTFSPDVAPLAAQNKIRTRPHLQQSRLTPCLRRSITSGTS